MLYKVVKSFVEDSGMVVIEKESSVGFQRLFRVFRYYCAVNKRVEISEAAFIVCLQEVLKPTGRKAAYVLSSGHITCRGIRLTGKAGTAMMANDSIDFVEDLEWCEIDPDWALTDTKTRRDDFYLAYVHWCEHRGLKPLTRSSSMCSLRSHSPLKVFYSRKDGDFVMGLRLLRTSPAVVTPDVDDEEL